MKKLLAIMLFVAGSASVPAVAATPSGATMLAPGVYTTADISRRCQTYTGRRVRGGMNDTSRQAVFIACVQKLYNEEYGGASAAAAPPPAPVEQGFVTAPVGLPPSDYGYYYNPDGYGCSTDEGFGRRGVCDTNAP